MANNTESKRADFILQLYLILIGLGFGFSIQSLIDTPISAASAIRFIIVIVLLVLWLQGQIAYGLSETYDVPARWLKRVFENYIEVASVILLMAVTLVQNRIPAFYFLVFFSYFFDLILEFLYVLRIRSVRKKYRREYEVALSWLYIDIVASVLFALFIVLTYTWPALKDLPASIAFLVVILILTFWDYSYNRDYYLGMPRKQTHS